MDVVITSVQLPSHERQWIWSCSWYSWSAGKRHFFFSCLHSKPGFIFSITWLSIADSWTIIGITWGTQKKKSSAAPTPQNYQIHIPGDIGGQGSLILKASQLILITQQVRISLFSVVFSILTGLEMSQHLKQSIPLLWCPLLQSQLGQCWLGQVIAAREHPYHKRHALYDPVIWSVQSIQLHRVD